MSVSFEYRMHITAGRSSAWKFTDRSLLRFLWLLCGATMALTSVSFFRLDVGNAHIAGPMFFIIAIVLWTSVMVLARHGRLKLEVRKRSLWVVLLPAGALLLWHALAITWSPRTPLAVREFVKIGAGYTVLFLIIGLMPRRGGTIERFWTATIWGGALLYGYMMYHSFYVWHMPLLATDLEVQSFLGRNHFAGTLAYQIPFAAAYAWASPRRVYSYLPFAVIGVALLASGSRSGVIGMTAALLTVAVSRSRIVGWWRALRPIVVAAAILALVAGVFVRSSGFDTEFLYRRFIYLWNPEAVPELHSYETRSLRIRGGLDHAAASPIIGLGAGQLEAVMELPHNDYINVLGDYGLVGEFLLLSVLGTVARRLFKRKRRPDARWTYHGARGAFVAVVVFMLTMDRVYSTIGFWIVMAMLTVVSEPPPESDDALPPRTEPAPTP